MTDAKPSKSARKREYQALQELGERLIELADDELAGIATDDYLLEQVREAKKISAHGALRRQKQLIGKLMRDLDPEPLQQALLTLGRQGQLEKAIFRCAESWRDRIVNEGQPALQQFYAETGAIDQTLTALVEKLHACAYDAGRRQLSRRLFRAVHRQLTRRMQNEAD